MFREKDREYLLQLCKMVDDLRSPPSTIGGRPEPTWAAILASEEKIVASAGFNPGDAKDAVAKILEFFPSGAFPDHTLYLSLEPRAGFERLPPTTESIKRLGPKRVVIGAEDPSPRYRGEGCRTLQRMGVELILADGEEARRCQIALEDYAKAVQRGLPVLRVPGALQAKEEGGYEFRAGSQPADQHRVDAVLGGNPIDRAWFIDVDLSPAPPMGGERVISYRPSPADAKTRRLPMKNGKVDLGGLLRDVCSLGILSVELNEASYFGQALAADLVDTVVARLPDSGSALSRYAKVRFRSSQDEFDLRLSGAKLSDRDARYLEARGELC